MPIGLGNNMRSLSGLSADDRTEEEKKEIDNINSQVNNYIDNSNATLKPASAKKSAEQVKSDSEEENEEGGLFDTLTSIFKPISSTFKPLKSEVEETSEDYKKISPKLDFYKDRYGVGRESVNTVVDTELDKVSRDVSSVYKMYSGDDSKLFLSEQDKKNIYAEYSARKDTYGEDAAASWLNNEYQRRVAKNQAWWEQGLNALGHMIPTMESYGISLYGMTAGLVDYVTGVDLPWYDGEARDQSSELGWFEGLWDSVMDNNITQYADQIERAGASHVLDVLNFAGLSDDTSASRIEQWENSKTKNNPDGLSADAIIETPEEQESIINATTPWQALYSNGFTMASILSGAGLAKGSQMIFGNLSKGAKYLNNAGKLLKTEKALEKALTGLKRAQNFADTFIIPGLVGTAEGALEGLHVKQETIRKGQELLDEQYKAEISKEAEELYNNPDLNPFIEQRTDAGKVMHRKYRNYGEALAEVINKHKEDYGEKYQQSLDQIEYAASKAGVHTFYTNSLINGFLNMTLQKGLMQGRVQEALRNNRLTGWMYRNPGFTINEAGEAVSTLGKKDLAWKVAKELTGEFMEEAEQNLASDTFSASAENNIGEFIDAKYNTDATVKVGDTFASDYAAGLSAFFGSLTSKETLQSGMLGAIGSGMGTFGGVGRGYHRNKEGKIVRNDLFSLDNFKRSLKADGTLESVSDYLKRVTPWRSSVMSGWNEYQREKSEADEMAATLTEWLKDPQNKAKWDGVNGTAAWLSAMENATESNDQFSYRKAQMGKAINDIFMLSRLKGTDLHSSIISDMKRMATLEEGSDEAQKVIEKVRNGSDESLKEKSDAEIIEKIQDNANKMLSLMNSVEKESSNVESLLGRVDDDTKQSLVFGKLMEKDFTERKEKLTQEINDIKAKIAESRAASGAPVNEDVKRLIAEHGSITAALHNREKLLEAKEKAEKKLKAYDNVKKQDEGLSDKDKKNIEKQKTIIENIDRQLQSYDALYTTDEKGNKVLDSNYAQLVLNEKEIMELDDITRAIMLAKGSTKLYNATHQDQQKVDQLNTELDDINAQIEALEDQNESWINSKGNIKKGHNKQYQRNVGKIANLKKEKQEKMRALDIARGNMETKSIFSEAQQAVIDNLVQQGMMLDEDFLNKVIDTGRLSKAIQDYHTDYQNILSDPNAYQNYVKGVKSKAQIDLVRRRAAQLARVEDYKEFSQGLDKMLGNASEVERMIITQTLKEENAKLKDTERQRRQKEALDNWKSEEDGELIQDAQGNVSVILSEDALRHKTNIDRYVENSVKINTLINYFDRQEDLTDNDKSLLADAMQYLVSNGIDPNDKEAVVTALTEVDEQGNLGGKFRQWVEDKNNSLSPQQRAYMSTYTSVGQLVNQYVGLLNTVEQEEAAAREASGTITIDASNIETATATAEAKPQTAAEETPKSSGVDLTPEPAKTEEKPAAGTGILSDKISASADEGFTEEEKEEAKEKKENKSVVQKAFEETSSAGIVEGVSEAEKIIDNSTESEEVKNAAKQALVDIATSSSETIEEIEDVIAEIEDKATELEESEQEENGVSGKTAGLLRKVNQRLYAKKKGSGKAPVKPKTTIKTFFTPSSQAASQPANDKTMANHIMSTDIEYMRSKNPNAWAVTFSDTHKIERWNKANWGKKDSPIGRTTPIYFITDSDWTSEVIGQMGNSYNADLHLPVVMAVKVKAPENPNNTTAIEVGGEWFQPVGILPGGDSKNAGSKRTIPIRQAAAKASGRHLIMRDTENALTTKPNGMNYLKMQNTEQGRVNSESTNSDLRKAILDFDDITSSEITPEERERLKSLPIEELLKDEVYRKLRNSVIDRLKWNDTEKGERGKTNIAFVPHSYHDNDEGQPMFLFRKPVNETTGKTSGKSLKETVEEGSLDDIIMFNSRTAKLYSEVIKPLFEHSIMDQVAHKKAKNARVITQDDYEKALETDPNIQPQDLANKEAARLQKLLNGYDGTKETEHIKGVSSFIWYKSIDEGNSGMPSGYKFIVEAPKELQKLGDMNTSETVFKVYIENLSTGERQELGTIKANEKNPDAAKELVKNILYDVNKKQVRQGLYWSYSKNDIKDLDKNDKAREKIADLIDDGIFTFAGSSLETYGKSSIDVVVPANLETIPAKPQAEVANEDNATIEASEDIDKGKTILDPDAGIVEGQPEGNTSLTDQQKQENLRKAEELVDRMKKDTANFTLSEDETYYYIKDNRTGATTKYLRVTTAISADESAPQNDREILEIVQKNGYEVPSNIRTLKELSQKGGEEAKKAVAEARSEYERTKYGVWGLPSTLIGNTVDTITRDLFAGNLKESYPNITKEYLDSFVSQLKDFKTNLEGMGIHIDSSGIVAWGSVKVKNEDGTTREANVAGTLDLFGYDDNGNFYIFDMKTVRNHSREKLENEKEKWSRQVSMYADLLEQKYGIKIDRDKLCIIPIEVDYPAPKGEPRKQPGTSVLGNIYSESTTEKGQLQATKSARTAPQDFNDSNPTMKGTTFFDTFKVGRHQHDISWDNLSSTSQSIINSQEENTADTGNKAKEEELETASNNLFKDSEPTSDAPSMPTVGTHNQPTILDSWESLTDKQKEALEDAGIDEEMWEQAMQDPLSATVIQERAKCKRIL